MRLRSLWPPRVFDLFVVALGILAQIEIVFDPEQTPREITAPAALLWTLPLLLTRRFPLGAPAVVFLILAGESLVVDGEPVTHAWVNAVALITAFGVAGAHENLRLGIAGAAIGFASLAAIISNEVPDTESAFPILVLSTGSWVIGRVLTERARRAAELERHANLLEHEHEAAVAAERARIARELHDVIAHSVSVMTVQAGAARLLLESDPERARGPLLSVEGTGRQALADMRRLLGILRGGDARSELAPQPSIADVDLLVDHVRSAGVATELFVRGEPRPLPPGVDLTAYRIIQEALTNVVKHATADRAEVELRYGAKELELEVRNDGPVVATGRDGHGLVGMRERVTLYGGVLEAAPRRDGGFSVRAKLPLNVFQP